MIGFAKRIFKMLYSRYLSLMNKSRIMNGVNLNFQTKLEGGNVIHSGVNIANSKIGYGSYIGPDSILPNAVIGRYCSIAGGVRIIAGGHPTKKFVSTHPAFFSISRQSGFTYVNGQKYEEIKYANPEDGRYIVVGNDVWIALNVMIMNGCIIGDGAIIAAGAVVTKNIDSYGIYAGVPARKIGQRFDDRGIQYLLNFKWWNKTPDWLRENSALFCDLDLLEKAFPIDTSIGKSDKSQGGNPLESPGK